MNVIGPRCDPCCTRLFFPNFFVQVSKFLLSTRQWREHKLERGHLYIFPHLLSTVIIKTCKAAQEPSNKVLMIPFQFQVVALQNVEEAGEYLCKHLYAYHKSQQTYRIISACMTPIQMPSCMVLHRPSRCSPKQPKNP